MERFKRGDVIKWATLDKGEPAIYEFIVLVKERTAHDMTGAVLYDGGGSRTFLSEARWAYLTDGDAYWPEEHYIKLSEGVVDGESKV